MIKPQEKYSMVFAKSSYPDVVQYYYELIVERMIDVDRENVELLAEEVYKDAYIDGFKDALFFSNKLD